MNPYDALSIILEAAQIRRQQWLSAMRAADNDHAIDGDLSDCIGELYEADHDECEEAADRLAVAITVMQDLQP